MAVVAVEVDDLPAGHAHRYARLAVVVVFGHASEHNLGLRTSARCVADGVVDRDAELAEVVQFVVEALGLAVCRISRTTIKPHLRKSNSRTPGWKTIPGRIIGESFKTRSVTIDQIQLCVAISRAYKD